MYKIPQTTPLCQLLLKFIWKLSKINTEDYTSHTLQFDLFLTLVPKISIFFQLSPLSFSLPSLLSLSLEARLSQSSTPNVHVTTFATLPISNSSSSTLIMSCPLRARQNLTQRLHDGNTAIVPSPFLNQGSWTVMVVVIWSVGQWMGLTVVVDCDSGDSKLLVR